MGTLSQQGLAVPQGGSRVWQVLNAECPFLFLSQPSRCPVAGHCVLTRDALPHGSVDLHCTRSLAHCSARAFKFRKTSLVNSWERCCGLSVVGRMRSVVSEQKETQCPTISLDLGQTPCKWSSEFLIRRWEVNGIFGFKVACLWSLMAHLTWPCPGPGQIREPHYDLRDC